MITLLLNVAQAAKMCSVFLKMFGWPRSDLFTGSILPRIGGSFMPCFFRQFLISA